MMTVHGQKRRTKTVSITSGKGGVGKTTILCNLAYALAIGGNRVLILDGDLGMSNVDIMFGVKVETNIHQVITGQISMSHAITSLGNNIDLISGGSGIVGFNQLSGLERRTLVDSLQSMESFYDYLLIDTAPGISDNVLYLNSASQEIVVIINPDPASVTDSYALIKVLYHEYREHRFSIICNQVRDEDEGLALYRRFNEVVSRFMFVGLNYWGAISQDLVMRKSTQNQRLVLRHEPTSHSARQLLNISAQLEKSLACESAKSGLQFFWDQVIGVA